MIASPTLRTFARRGLTALAVACLPLLTGGWIHGPQSTFDTKGPVAEAQLQVFYVTLWVTGIIFVLVAGVLTYATLKFKARNAADEHAPVPPQGHGNPLIELGLIGLSVIALVFIAIPTLHHIWYTYDVPEEEKANAVEVNAIGYQWWFKFEYPNEHIAADTPLELQLIDHTVMPQKGQPVVTWGSEGGAPYVSGVPIGEVSRVYQDLRAGTYRTVLEPYVDFTSLDQVGVIVPSGGEGVIEPGACG